MKQNTSNEDQRSASVPKSPLVDDSKDKAVVGNKRSTRGYHPKYEEKSSESLFLATRKRRKTDAKEKQMNNSEKPSLLHQENSNFVETGEQAHDSEHANDCHGYNSRSKR